MYITFFVLRTIAFMIHARQYDIKPRLAAHYGSESVNI